MSEVWNDPREIKKHWMLDPEVTFLNHGSFGACPREVLLRQRELQDRIEREPVRFFTRDFEGLLDQARHDLAAFLEADPEGLVFVPNATTAVNTVLRSLDLCSDDQLLTTNHEYGACRNALDFVADRSGAEVVVATIPYPLDSPDLVLEALLEKVTSKTRLLLIDHVTSPTGMVLPVESIVAAMRERGVETLVDGAHAPGMVPVDLTALSAAYYSANCHKWLCSPKGAALLHVREDLRASCRPLTISHGATSARADRSRFLEEFFWTGTRDPTPWLCVPRAIEVMASFVEGGWPQVMRRNRHLALEARKILSAALDELSPEASAPCPDTMIGSLVALPLPPSEHPASEAGPLQGDRLHEALIDDYGIQVPVISWPSPPQRLIRVSSQLYNVAEEYQRLADALVHLLTP